MASINPLLPRVSIDAAGHPHLIDLILKAASLRALLAYRSTSLSCQSQIDLYLRRDRHPCHMVLKLDMSGRLQISFRDGDVAIVPKDPVVTELLTSCTQIVDVRGTCSAPRTRITTAPLLPRTTSIY